MIPRWNTGPLPPPTTHTTNTSYQCVPNPDGSSNGVVLSYVITALVSIAISVGSRLHLRVFQNVIETFGATQMLSGWAILITCLHTYNESRSDPHLSLALLLALLANYTQAILLWTDSDSVTMKTPTACCRIALNVTHSFVFMGPYSIGGWDISPLPTLVWTGGFFLQILCLIQNLSWFFVPRSGRTASRCRTIFIALVVFLTLLTCAVVLYIKYRTGACSLNTNADNQGTFGQWFAIIMALSPFYYLLEELLNSKIPDDEVATNSQEPEAFAQHRDQALKDEESGIPIAPRRAYTL